MWSRNIRLRMISRSALAVLIVAAVCGVSYGMEIPAAIHKIRYVRELDPKPELSPAQRAAAMLAQMNITEKINMVHGWN